MSSTRQLDWYRASNTVMRCCRGAWVCRLASYADTVAGQRLALSPCLAESVEEVEQRYKAVEEVWASPEPVSGRGEAAMLSAVASEGGGFSQVLTAAVL